MVLVLDFLRTYDIINMPSDLSGFHISKQGSPTAPPSNR